MLDLFLLLLQSYWMRFGTGARKFFLWGKILELEGEYFNSYVIHNLFYKRIYKDLQNNIIDS